MKLRFRLFPANRWLEPLLALAIAAGIVRAILYFQEYGHLPQPFFFEPNDVWMDWFNTSYWAHDRGVYDTWRTIYPPLSFVFLGIFGKASCYTGAEGYSSRDCDWVGVVSLHAFFLLNALLIARTFWKIDRSTAIPRTFALAAGLPMLYALERGNLIIVTFTCVLLAFGPLVRSARLRWLAVGLAVNFKVYLVAALFPQLLRRRWRWFEGAVLATISVYLTTYAILGAGTPYEIYDNIANFSGVYQAINFLDLWYAGTYTPLVSLLTGSVFPIISIVGSDRAETWSQVLPLLLHGVQATILLAAIAAWLRPEVVPMYRLTNLGASLALITAESGGYTQVILIFFVFMEKWKGMGRKWAIVACYLLCIPADIVIHRLNPALRDSFLAGRPVIVEYAITVGPFVRPALIMSLPFALACVTIRAVWIDIQRQGWKTRWRFRRDAPIMVGSGKAIPPSAAEPS
jgi:hypothetical protein